MVILKEQLEINYKRLSLTNPNSFINYALDLTKEIQADYGRIKKITYFKGHSKESGKGRIHAGRFNELTVDQPTHSTDKFKLANLLWALSRCGTISSRIICVGNKKYEVSTAHKREHQGKLQVKIKKSINSSLEDRL